MNLNFAFEVWINVSLQVALIIGAIVLLQRNSKQTKNAYQLWTLCFLGIGLASLGDGDNGSCLNYCYPTGLVADQCRCGNTHPLVTLANLDCEPTAQFRYLGARFRSL